MARDVVEMVQEYLSDDPAKWAKLASNIQWRRLELLLLKSLKGGEDKTSTPMLWRNLGVIHFHQRKYDRAQQELKKANEFNPRDARTHFYLARLLSHQAEICQRKGLKKKARGLAKQAATEMELARKFAPNNPTYHQDLKQLMQQEQGK